METRKPRRYRIRRCSANREAWMLVALRDDGSESDSYGSFATSTSLDMLIKHAGHLTPQHGDFVELAWESLVTMEKSR